MIKKELLAIRKLLLIIVIPLVLYLLSVLSMIFIPLMFALFIALLFSPLMRWFARRKLPNILGVITALFIVSLVFIGAFEIVQISGEEIANSDPEFRAEFNSRVGDVLSPVVEFLKIEPKPGQNELQALLSDEKVTSNLFGNLSNSLKMTRKFISMLLMTLFFMVLFLAGSINMQNVMKLLIFKHRYTSIRTFREIEKDVFKFIIVKIILSFFTGLGFSIVCYAFGVNFPIFWGVFAFLINFVQMVGSVISVVVLTIFAMVELQLTGNLLFFALMLTGVQVLFGGVLEPILMGKSFSINTVTVLVMLALWGFIWGIPGLILAIPITSLVKKIMAEIPGTRVYAYLMS